MHLIQEHSWHDLEYVWSRLVDWSIDSCYRKNKNLKHLGKLVCLIAEEDLLIKFWIAILSQSLLPAGASVLE